MEKTTMDTFYTVVDSTQNVMIEIITDAPGQTCGTTIKLNNSVKVEGHKGSYQEKPLDTNNNLAGQTLYVTTTISNTSGGEAKAQVIIRLKGGESSCQDILSKTIPAGDSETFTYICEFFKSPQ